MTEDKASSSGKLGLWAVASIGIGGMVGGGIFAVLGLAAKLAGGGTPIAFFVAGLVALATSYSYVKLSLAYPSQGGTVEFLNQAFGTGICTGALNALLWLSYIIMLSLYAHAFGSYGASFFAKPQQAIWAHIFLSAIIILLTALNALGAAAVGAVETWVVGIKITILVAFAVIGARFIDVTRVQPSTWQAPLSLVAGGMIIFLAYEGFELIANTARDVRNPSRTLPRAYYGAVIFVILLYIAVALVTVGNLSVPQIVAAEDYALAAAAKPFLGQFGFTMIAAAALLSTASAINATLYGSARLSYIIAKDGQLPALLERKVWRRPIEGLILTSAATLVVANVLDLSRIAITGSAGFLLIFAAVNFANAKMHRRVGSSAILAWIAGLACVGALVALVWQTVKTDPANVLVFPAMVLVGLAIEVGYRKLAGRTLKAWLDRGADNAPDEPD